MNEGMRSEGMRNEVLGNVAMKNERINKGMRNE